MALRSLGSIKKLKMKQKELKLLAVRSHKEIEERLKIRKRY